MIRRLCGMCLTAEQSAKQQREALLQSLEGVSDEVRQFYRVTDKQKMWCLRRSNRAVGKITRMFQNGDTYYFKGGNYMETKEFPRGCLDAEWAVEREEDRDRNLTFIFNKMDEVDEDLWRFPAIENAFEQFFWVREQVRSRNSENWQERDKEDWRECSEIQKGVQEGYPEVAEILLDEGKVHYRRKEYLLGNTMIRLRTEEFWDDYFLFKDGDRCSARIFINGWGLQKAFLVVDSETEGSTVFRLSEFYLLGLCDTPCYGMSIYYPMFPERLFQIDAIIGFNLIAIQKLLLGGWLENKWAEAERESKGERDTAEEES